VKCRSCGRVLADRGGAHRKELCKRSIASGKIERTWIGRITPLAEAVNPNETERDHRSMSATQTQRRCDGQRPGVPKMTTAECESHIAAKA